MGQQRTIAKARRRLKFRRSLPQFNTDGEIAVIDAARRRDRAVMDASPEASDVFRCQVSWFQVQIGLCEPCQSLHPDPNERSPPTLLS